MNLTKYVRVVGCAVILLTWTGMLAQADTGEPAAWWQFNDTAVDVVNKITLSPKESPEYADGALIFRGSQYLRVRDPLLDMGTTDFSLEATFKLDQYPENHAILIGKGNKGLGGVYYLAVLKNGQIRARLNDDEGGDASVLSGKVKCELGKWYHVAATHDRDDMLRLYVNGDLAGIVGISHVGDIDNSDIFTIGMLWTQFFNGAIDDIRVYRHALTENKVKGNFKEAVSRHNAVDFEIRP